MQRRRSGVSRSAIRSVWAGVAAVLAVVSAAPAQTTDVVRRLSEPGTIFSARALGMGNAYSTIGYDFSGTRFNPATMAVLDSTTFAMSVNFLASPNDAAYRDAVTPFTTTSTSLGQFGMTFPVHLGQRSSVFALGFSQSKDFNRNTKFDAYNSSTSSLIQDLTSYGSPIPAALGLNYAVTDPISGQVLGRETVINGNLQQSGFILESGNFLQISAGASFEMMPNVFVGVSASYNSGSYLADREFSEVDANNVYDASINDCAGRSDDGRFPEHVCPRRARHRRHRMGLQVRGPLQAGRISSRSAGRSWFRPITAFPRSRMSEGGACLRPAPGRCAGLTGK